MAQGSEKAEVNEITAQIFVSSQNYVVLQNICCVDAEGHVFEHYDELYIQKEVVKEKKGHYVLREIPNENPTKEKEWEIALTRLTCPRAISYFEEKGEQFFLPSIALQCNILVGLHQQALLGEEDAKNLLLQYKNLDRGYGWHAQNTLINYDWNRIIHYPTPEDFTRKEEEPIFNEPPRVALPFSPHSLADTELCTGLDHPDMAMYIRNLTGLRNPEQLAAVGKYLGLETKLQFPFRRDEEGKSDPQGQLSGIYPAWLGGVTYLHLSSFLTMDFAYGARGVSVTNLPGMFTAR